MKRRSGPPPSGAAPSKQLNMTGTNDHLKDTRSTLVEASATDTSLLCSDRWAVA